MFPLLYHAHHSRHLEDLPFWLSLAKQQGSPLLELGCGTGRVLLPLARAGFEAWGLDKDAGMLRILQSQRTAEDEPRLHVFQADLAAFGLGIAFGLVLLPCNTLSTLAPAARLAAFECIRRHLRPGGLFAASLPNPVLLRRLPRQSVAMLEEVFPHPLDGSPVQVSSGWERSAGEFTVTWHYDYQSPGGQFERLVATVCHHLASAHTYQEELRLAGLEVVQKYGDFDGSTYTATAPELILLARPAGRR